MDGNARCSSKIVVYNMRIEFPIVIDIYIQILRSVRWNEPFAPISKCSAIILIQRINEF